MSDLVKDLKQIVKIKAGIDFDDVPYYLRSAEELEEQLAETIRLSAEKHRPAYDEQQQRIAELEQQLDKLKRMEFICSRCGIRKDGESEGGDF